MEAPGEGAGAAASLVVEVELLLLAHEEEFPERVEVLHAESPEHPRGDQVAPGRVAARK